MDKLYTVKEVADNLKLSVRKVYDLIKQKKLKVVKIDRSTRIREIDLQRFKDNL